MRAKEAPLEIAHALLLGKSATNAAIKTLCDSLDIPSTYYDDDASRARGDKELRRDIKELREVLEEGQGALVAITTPGIPPSSALIAECKRARVPILSDYDFLHLYAKDASKCGYKAPFSIYITGTNGKTTTTQMSALLCDGIACGNIGVPLGAVYLQTYGDDLALEATTGSIEDGAKGARSASAGALSLEKTSGISGGGFATATGHSRDARCAGFASAGALSLEKTSGISGGGFATATGHSRDARCAGFASAGALSSKPLVVETSSFTLHYTNLATPSILAILPLHEDHISWHGSFEAYKEAKVGVAYRMDRGSIIAPMELVDEGLLDRGRLKARLYTYSYLDFSQVLGSDEAMTRALGSLRYKGAFLQDALMALSIEKLYKEQSGAIYSPSASIARLNAFVLDPHKVEELVDKEGYLFIDDSKGTNVDATCVALDMYKGRDILLILGGDDKGADLAPLFTQIVEKMREEKSYIHIYATGSNTERLASYARRYEIACTPCHTLSLVKEPIIKALKRRDREGVCVMLSPAAASLDEYSSYKERGALFRSLFCLAPKRHDK